MEENFNKINNNEISENTDIDYNIDSFDGNNSQKFIEYKKIEENTILKKSAKENKNPSTEKINFINRFYKCINDINYIQSNNQDITDIKKQYKTNGIALSNTSLLVVISIIIFIFVYKTNNFLKTNIYKEKNIWMLFILYLISFYASSTNFPLKLVNNYIFSIYLNQILMFIISIILMCNLLSRNQNNE